MHSETAPYCLAYHENAHIQPNDDPGPPMCEHLTRWLFAAGVPLIYPACRTAQGVLSRATDEIPRTPFRVNKFSGLSQSYVLGLLCAAVRYGVTFADAHSKGGLPPTDRPPGRIEILKDFPYTMIPHFNAIFPAAEIGHWCRLMTYFGIFEHKIKLKRSFSYMFMYSAYSNSNILVITWKIIINSSSISTAVTGLHERFLFIVLVCGLWLLFCFVSALCLHLCHSRSVLSVTSSVCAQCS
jgi:hypothetical protein